MEIKINCTLTVDTLPALIEVLSAIASGVDPKQTTEAAVAAVGSPQVEIVAQPKPAIISDADLREVTSAAVKKVGQEEVLGILREVGNTNKIVDLSQEERNIFVQRIQSL